MKVLLKGRRTPALFICLLLLCSLQTASAFAQKWSFAVFSDNRNFEEAYRNVLEEIKADQPADPNFPPSEFVVGVGDIDPVKRTVQIHKEVFGASLPFIPVRGNHESGEDLQFMLQTVLPSEKPPVTTYDNKSATFYYDHKNVRVIAIDQYAPYARDLTNNAIVAWVKKAIESANKADHIFVTFHEPYIPIDFATDPFWGLLLKHSDKVRAVFIGHTHMFGERFISGTYGGIYLINAGNAGNIGHSDHQNTFVQVSVDNKEVLFRAVQTPDKQKKFEVTDQWKIKKP